MAKRQPSKPSREHYARFSALGEVYSSKVVGEKAYAKLKTMGEEESYQLHPLYFSPEYEGDIPDKGDIIEVSCRITYFKREVKGKEFPVYEASYVVESCKHVD